MSVIVPVRNAQDHIAMCLRAIQQSSVLPAEVLVVDDGSQDGSADVAERLGAHVLRLPKSRGPAAARNAGADAARQPVLMFLDADVMVHTNTIELVDAALSSDSAVGAVFGAYDDAPLALGLVSQYRNLLHHFTHCTARRDAWTFWAGCGAIRRDLFLACGGYDERYAEPSIEDIELGLRLRRAGVRIRVVPEIQVCHMKKWTLWGILRTDVLLRAWPWSRLLLRSGCLPADLNLDWRQRASALLAWLCVGLAAAGFVRGAAFFGAILAATALALFNRPFFGFLIRARGFVFVLRAFPLHVLYLLYSSATFTVAAVVHFLPSMRPHPLARNPRGPEAGI
jgi:glycosyltransferase involved in cell wall biosynthesis